MSSFPLIFMTKWEHSIISVTTTVEFLSPSEINTDFATSVYVMIPHCSGRAAPLTRFPKRSVGQLYPLSG